jgi:subtilisin family serine protease
MPTNARFKCTLACLATAALVACEGVPLDPTADTGPSLAVIEGEAIPYIVVLGSANATSSVERRLSRSGATVTGAIPQIAALLVSSTDPDFLDFAQRIGGVVGVVPDLPVEGFGRTADAVFLTTDAEAAALPPNTGDDDVLLDFLWGHTAVDAFGAWAQGQRGAGVRVAILDSGIDAEHPDLAPNLNVDLSASFIEGEDWNIQPGVYFNHGTHVAGTVAAADNAFGTIGIAPEAELVAVKVLSEVDATGPFSSILQGLVYAGDIGADVANMSLRGYVFPGVFDRFQHGVSRFYVALQVLVNRAAAYASNAGVTIVVAAGNEEVDGDKDRSQKIIPSMSPHVITVSATAPEGWALDPGTDLDLPASYTNYGRSLIDLAGPGGDFDPPTTDLCVVSISAPRPCAIYDGVLSTVSGTWAWATGTSMATPHVAGVAALIIGANGGSMHPAAVFAQLRKSADDLGQPGADPYYGSGRVNAANAVR